MGMNQSKEKMPEMINNDWKYMQAKDSTSTKCLAQWKKDFDFDGRLTTISICKLIGRIEKKMKNNPKKAESLGLPQARRWLEEAKKREEGVRRKKEAMEGEPKFHRKDEPPTTMPRASYPRLNTSEKPPPCPEIEDGVNTGPQSKGGGMGFERSESLSRGGSGLAGKANGSDGHDEVTKYPMIETTNPRAGEPGQNPRIVVYRTWTLDDIKKAAEGTTSHKEDVGKFVAEMEELRHSYCLNGFETQQVWMTALQRDWVHVRGDWNPTDAGGAVLQHDKQELNVRVAALIGRTRERYRPKANYGVIGRTKQRDDELFEDFVVRMTKVFKSNSGLEENDDENGAYGPYLKNALHEGSLERIRHWVSEYYIGMSSGTLEEYITYAVHAEEVTKNEKRSEVDYQGRGRGGYRKNRGRGRGGGFRVRVVGMEEGSRRGAFGRGRGRDVRCWECGEKGHFARVCPKHAHQGRLWLERECKWIE